MSQKPQAFVAWGKKQGALLMSRLRWVQQVYSYKPLGFQ